MNPKHASRRAPEPSLIGLPEDLRVRLFEKYVTTPSDLLSLRSVCHLFHKEIDDQVGILNVISFDEYTLEELAIRHFYSTVAIRNIQYDYPYQTNLQDIILAPHKLESVLIDGTIHSDFILQVLKQFSNLKSFQVKADITSEVLQPSYRTKLPHLKTLNITSGQTMPVPDSLRKDFFKVCISNSMALLRSIQANKLISLEFHQLLNKLELVPIDLLDLLHDVFKFLSIHSSLKIVDISIASEVLDVGDIEESEPLQFIIRKACHLKKDIDEQRRKNLGKLLQGMNKAQKYSNSCETVKLIWNLEEESDLWLQYLGLFKKLKNLGLKLAKPYKWLQISPVLSSNSQFLTNIYLQCTFTTSINFSNFGGCSNLISISLHHQNYPSPTRIRLYNISAGLDFLPSLEAVIIDCLIVSGSEMEVLSAWNLKVLGLKGVIAVAYFGDDIIPFGDQDHGDGPGIPDQNGLQGPELTGVTYQSFKNLMNNRNLEALLVDMDSISVTRMDHGLQILNMRDAISGMFQSLFMDIRDWESNCCDSGGKKDAVNSKSTLKPYWRTTFLGFSVQFPFLS